MAFGQASTLLSELDALDGARPMPTTAPWRPVDHEVGAALVSIAAGKHDWRATDIAHDEAHQARRRSAAQRVLLAYCLRPEAGLYELLAVREDASPEQIREAYRRMIALVHPDASPVGFPADAASRVNLAYSTLGDAQKRAAYDANTSMAPVVYPGRNSPSSAPESRSRGASTPRRLRVRASRRTLLWLAALLVVPAAALIYSALPGNGEADLIEARPKLKLSDAPSPLAGAESAPATLKESTASSDVPPTAGVAPGSVTEATANGDSPAASAPAPLSGDITPQPGAGRAVASTTTRADPAQTSQAAPATSGSRRTTAPPGPSTLPSPVEAPVATLPRTDGAVTSAAASGAPPATPPVATEPTVSLTPAGSAVAIAVAPGRTATESAVRLKAAPTIDADDVLLRLVTAYETGSTAALARLLSPNMAGRRSLLADYERIFHETTARTLRLGKLRHQLLDDRVRSTGPATVVTTGRDQQTAEQRVYLEIDIVRDREQIFIERLASYAAK